MLYMIYAFFMFTTLNLLEFYAYILGELNITLMGVGIRMASSSILPAKSLSKSVCFILPLHISSVIGLTMIKQVLVTYFKKIQ
ncbi:hypothetical protein JHL18_15575 [Clostridium sp. YIM B02505]|uniref:Uncharacterized protein n=1 Tax=Clostridium yunnanense TaxID=2800325 RepID=A0ABS1ERS7_9CLOT|nr:hypothetical protein [Clostridium yunnanense]